MANAWALLQRASGTWLDPLSAADAIALASIPPDDLDVQLGPTRRALLKHAELLLDAACTIWVLAGQLNSDITFDVANPILQKWATWLTCLGSALRNLDDIPCVEMDVPCDDATREFLTLANRYIASTPDESAECLETILQCALVVDANESIAKEREDVHRGRTEVIDVWRHVRSAVEEYLRGIDQLVAGPHIRMQIMAKIRTHVQAERDGTKLLGVGHAPLHQRTAVCRALEGLLAGSLDKGTVTNVIKTTARREYLNELRGRIGRTLRRGQSRPPRPPGLDPIEDVLKVRENTTAKWFRKTGATAADFDSGCVCLPEKLLSELEIAVMTNSVFLLKGRRATGKTTLARALIYKLWSREFKESYQFDCRSHRDYDPEQLATFICASDALFLLEDMHLKPDKLQRLCSLLLKDDLDGHVLITLRTPLHQDSRIEQLKDLPSKELKPFESANDIIGRFAARCRHPSVLSSGAIQYTIRNLAENDYWLLSYALEGCDDAVGEGEPITWLAKGVEEDLEDLWRANGDFPRVLCSLAPLSRREVGTSESYLIGTLKFSRDILVDLLGRGEILRFTEHGHFFYALPHSSLARAYWEHGRPFRSDLPEYADSLRLYAQSRQPNGLTAILTADPDIRRDVLVHFKNSGTLAEIVESEQSMEAVLSNIRELMEPCSRRLLSALAAKLMAGPNGGSVCCCLANAFERSRRIAALLWSLLDLECVARKVVEDRDPGRGLLYLLRLSGTSPGRARNLCRLLRADELAVALRSPRIQADAAPGLCALYRVNRQAAADLWKLLKSTACGAEILAWIPYRSTGRRLEAFAKTSDWRTDVARELGRELDVPAVARDLLAQSHCERVLDTIWGLNFARKRLGKAVWNALDKLGFAAQLTFSDDRNAVCIALAEASGNGPAYLEELYGALGPSAVAAAICQAEPNLMGTCISWIRFWLPRRIPDICRELHEQLGRLAQIVLRTDESATIEERVALIHYLDRDSCKEFLSLLNKRVLVDRLEQARFHGFSTLVLTANDADPKWAKRLVEILNMKRVACSLNETRDRRLAEQIVCVMKEIDHPTALELLDLLHEDLKEQLVDWCHETRYGRVLSPPSEVRKGCLGMVFSFDRRWTR